MMVVGACSTWFDSRTALLNSPCADGVCQTSDDGGAINVLHLQYHSVKSLKSLGTVCFKGAGLYLGSVDIAEKC